LGTKLFEGGRMIWARMRRWSPISGLHQAEGSSLQIGMPGRPTIWDNLV
jgi:hypothetical protein